MAKRKTDDLAQRLQAAKSSGSYMVAVWKVHDGKIDLFRVTENFPFVEIPVALDMLRKDLEPITMKKDQ